MALAGLVSLVNDLLAGLQKTRLCDSLALLLEQNDEWQLQRRYMQLEGLKTASENSVHRLSTVVTR